MRRNISGQFIGCQLVSKTDGSAVTSGTTTVYVTGDAGTQGAGSVGAGACTHEGNGYWTYAPAQAETNYTQVAYTFVNTAAVNSTVQVFPTAYDASGRVDVGAVLGTAQTARDLGAQLDGTITSRMASYTQPSGFLSATFPTGTVANTTNITAGTITTTTNLTNAPTAGDLTATMKASVTAAVPTTTQIRTDLGLAAANLDTQLTALSAAIAAASPTNHNAASDTETTGTLIGGTYASTTSDNASYWVTAPVTPAVGGFGLNVELGFDIGMGRIPSSFTLVGKWAGASNYVHVWAYDYEAAEWVQLSNTETRYADGSVNVTQAYALTSTMVDVATGAVSIRFTSTSTDTSHRWSVDYVLLSSVLSASSGLTADMIASTVWQYIIPHGFAPESAGHLVWHLNAIEASITDVTSSSVFTVAEGPTTADAYKGHVMQLINTATGVHEMRMITGWTAGRVVTLDRALSFTPEVGTHIHVSGVAYIPDTMATAASVTALDAVVDVVQATSDLIYGKVSNLSISNRLQTTLPASIIRAASGDKYVKVDFFLTDADGNMFDSRDHDGGDWSTSSHFRLGHRVLPTANNAGGYFFEMTTYNDVDAGSTAADWSTAQTPAQTCVSGNGDTWTNIGLSPSVTGAHSGFGILVADESGNDWTLYADNAGTPLVTLNECHHHGASSLPQIVPRIATGTYSLYMNVDDAETARSVHFYIGWFDMARWEVGYTSAQHKRQLAQMQIDLVADLSSASIATACAAEILVTPANKLATDATGYVTAENMVSDVSSTVSDISGRIPAALAGGKMDASVGAYQTGSAPADSILVTPANKLATDGNGYVTEANVDGIKKNTALANFEFLMVDSADHVTAKTGLTITATRSIDGGAFGACANSATEISDGIYKISFANTDLNGDVITFKFSAAGADVRFITVKTNL